MNHFLLATSRNDQKGDLKYGVHAMELLINHLLHAGASRQDLLAKVFGGARMLEHSGDIGRTNASFALDFLDKEGITCLAQSVGGTSARRIRFHPTSGAAQQMQVKTAVRETPVPVAPKADVTLF
ncbi:chemotaxis protein CheD [Yoonia litorea]|nr:chemotaxis protein CheD [Yoonia litorea]